MCAINFYKKVFILGLKLGELVIFPVSGIPSNVSGIPFNVSGIPFPVFKTIYWMFQRCKTKFVKQVFFIVGLKVVDIG